MLRRTSLVLFRSYSTASEPKASIKLVAELRKRTEVSLSKARDALNATNNDVDAAMEWLQKDLEISGALKAAKVQNRSAREGLIGVNILSSGTGSGSFREGVRAAMVELNCETDFVGRNQLFGQLAEDIAHTAAFMSETQVSGSLITPCSLDMLQDAPLLPAYHDPSTRQTVIRVGNAINNLIAKVGEKISLRRAVSVVQNPLPSSQPDLGLRVASYVHGTQNVPSQGRAGSGRIGSLALLALKFPHLRNLIKSQSFQEDLEKLERSLARQIVGFETRSIHSPDEKEETALYNQPFMMFAGGSTDEAVRLVLKKWAEQRRMAQDDHKSGVEVLEFAKWTVGEEL